MARVEKEHELFFLSVVTGHRLLPLMCSLFKWGLPAPAETPDIDAAARRLIE